MRKLILYIMLCLSIPVNAAVGDWNAYLAYSNITDIEPAGKMVYVLSSNSLFSYNVDDKSVTAYNKTNYLNDTDISFIVWNNNVKRLLIIYSNYNFDILDNNGDITNICDYYNKSMTEDKNINNITINGNYAYISTGFGIIKLNMKDCEISDSYNLKTNVADCAIIGNTIYAKTADGILAGKTTDNLLDKGNWSYTSDNVSFSDSNDITTSTANGYKEYIAYDNSNNCYWSNQKDGKLQCYKLDNDNNKTIIATDICPDGPKYNHFWNMKFKYDRLYSVGGAFEAGEIETYRPGCVQVLDKGEWQIYEDNLKAKTGVEYVDLNSIDVDPLDKEHVFAGGRTGLYEFKNGLFINHYSNENSIIESPFNSKEYDIVNGLCFDNTGNLWLLNSLVDNKSIIKYTSDKKWESYNKSATKHSDNSPMRSLKSTIFDSDYNLMWFINSHYLELAIFCYQPSTDAIIKYNTFINEDGLTISLSDIDCLAEDKDGNIWIGSTAGPFVLEKENIGEDPSNVVFNQIKIPRNDGTNLADYLLSGVNIKCIAIDGGGRKWIGTDKQGVYLISRDNMTEELHFTKENSMLLSNTIESIAVDGATGEVFIGTDKGLCSFMSDGTDPSMDISKDNVYAYPNPVKPYYNGLVTVKGLTYNSDVKVVTTNGVLVAQGRSNGGTFTWDCNDLNGKRVASGVYMIIAATENGGKGCVCKIAIVN